MSAEDAQEAVDRLARLSPFDYDRCRDAEAKRLGIRTKTLDDAVSKRRRDLFGEESDMGQGHQLDIDDPEPWADAVDGAELLEDLSASVRRYVVVGDAQGDAIALWVLFSYLIEAVQVAPILSLVSPEKRCGKTTLISWLAAVVSRPLPASNVSPAAVFRAVEKWKPSLLIDEADAFMGSNEELRGILNSGHTRASAYVVRVSGEELEPRIFSTWCAKAIARIGKPTDTLLDRSIVIELRRRLATEAVEKLGYNGDAANLDEFRRRCVRFALDHAEQIGGLRPDAPATLHDRAADNWTPLLAIAVAAGGDWPQRAWQAAKTLSVTDDEAAGIGVELLRDIEAIFEPDGLVRIVQMPLGQLVEALSKDEEKRWASYNIRTGKPITVRQLGRRLLYFGIKSKTLREGEKVFKGYAADQFVDAFERYLGANAPKPASSGLHGYNPTATGESGDCASGYTDQRNQPPGYTSDVTGGETARIPTPDVACNRVTGENHEAANAHDIGEHWLIEVSPGAKPIEKFASPPISRADLQRQYPGARLTRLAQP